MNLGIFALVGVIMLVLSGASFGYLLQIQDKSRSSWMLLWFFVCIMLSSSATILTNTGTAWAWAFAPAQDATLILGGVFLVRFAYLYPVDDQPGEARTITTIFSLLALIAIGYALVFGVQYLTNLPEQLEENQAYYLITPVAILVAVLLFFRRSIHCSSRAMDSAGNNAEARGILIEALLRPKNQPALALRNYGLALAIGLIPAVVTVAKDALPALLASFLFNFGVVAAIAVIMLVYLSHAPEPTNISAKLVGISLVSVLLILGFASVWLILNIPGTQVHNTVLMFIFLVLLSSIIIIVVFPQFFRSTLLDPLNKLLVGVKAANEGDLDIQVAVQYEDEVGFLTHSFNRMVSSLNDATESLKNESMILETEVAERTAELRESNEQLIRENIERKSAEERLDRQLDYQRALANCSQILLQTPQDADQRIEILNTALAQLIPATGVGRAYVFHNFIDNADGECFGILAEACAPGVPAHLPNPENRKVQWSQFPEIIYAALASNQSYGGPTERVFAEAKLYLEAFKRQQPPLLSIQLIPIFFEDHWWGFIGFDDVREAREWDQEDILLLRTASEMVGSTLQRWEAEARLNETLDKLEVRVEERTAELSQANARLIDEIQHRQRTQNELEARLEIEIQLESISSRLQETIDVRENMLASLENLGKIMNAGRVFMIEFEPEKMNRMRDYYEWHKPGLESLPGEGVQSIVNSLRWTLKQLKRGETIYIEELAQLPPEAEAEKRVLEERKVQSLVLSPLMIDQLLHGVLGCSNFQSTSLNVKVNMHAFDLVTGMFENLLQREHLIQTLEEQVAERTHQLTTFLDMAMISNQEQDLTDILQPTLVAISNIANCDACNIHILDENKNNLQLIAQRGIPIESMEQVSEIEIDAEFIGWLENAENFQGLGERASSPVFPDPFCIPGYHAFFATRLSAGGISQGLLSCYRLADQPFSPFQATIMAALGELLGIIIENYRLRTEAEELAAIEERQRLARDIHDAVSQSVYSLSLFARSANDALDAGDEAKLLSNLRDLEGTSLQAMREMRLLLYQLREPGEDAGILAAIETRFNQVERRLGMQATCEIDQRLILPSHLRQEIWRIITEALNNTLKHAEASQIHVQIIGAKGSIIARVQDDGIGFNTNQESAGMGLDNMRARAVEIGGALDITSAPGGGTLVRLEIPAESLDQEARIQE